MYTECVYVIQSIPYTKAYKSYVMGRFNSRINKLYSIKKS